MTGIWCQTLKQRKHGSHRFATNRRICLRFHKLNFTSLSCHSTNIIINLTSLSCHSTDIIINLTSQMDEKYLRGIFIAQKTPKHAKVASSLSFSYSSVCGHWSGEDCSTMGPTVSYNWNGWSKPPVFILQAEVDVDSPTEPRSMQEVPGVEEHHRFRIHNDNEVKTARASHEALDYVPAAGSTGWVWRQWYVYCWHPYCLTRN